MENTIYQITKKISLLLAGSLLGITFSLYKNDISQYTPWIISTIFVLILYGFGLVEGIFGLWVLINRKINNRRKKICIYAPYEINNKNSSWINVCLAQFKKELDNKCIKYSFKKTERSFSLYPIVINPYGGVYPEKDASTLQSLNNIFDYVRKGGKYLNIADIPFYYAFDESLKRRIDTTPLAGDYSLDRSFFQTLLTKKLHCFVYGLLSGEDFDNDITRIISLSENTKNFFDKRIKIINSDLEYSPSLAIPYGKGHFVFSTRQLNENNLEIFSQLIGNIFKKIYD